MQRCGWPRRDAQQRELRRPRHRSELCLLSCVDVRVVQLRQYARIAGDWINAAFAADGINSLTGLVVEHIVAIADRRQALNHLPRICIEYKQSRRKPGDDEQPVAGLVEGHGIVRQRYSGGPRRDYRSLFPVENGDFSRPR